MTRTWEIAQGFDPSINEDITVYIDQDIYELPRISYEFNEVEEEGEAYYGAPFDSSLGDFNYSEYPINVGLSYQDNKWSIYVAVDGDTIDGNNLLFAIEGNKEAVHKIDPKYYDTGVHAASAENEGQALVSTKKYVKGAVIVPEQTVTTDDGYGEASLSGVITPSIGDIVIITVNDVEAVTTVYEEGDALYTDFLNDEEEGGAVDYTNNKLWGMPETTYTVSVYVAEPVYSWEPDPYVGYDVVIKLDNSIESVTDNGLHLIKGSFSKCLERMNSVLPLNVCVFFQSFGSGGYVQTSTYLVDIYGYYNYGDQIEIRVHSLGSGIASIRTIYLTESGLSLTSQ